MPAYTLKRNKRSRHLKIRLDDSGHPVVTAPPHVPKVVINLFVAKSNTWITKQQRQLKLKQTAYPTLDWDQGLVSVKGKLYYIKFDPDGQAKIHLGGKYLSVTPVTLQESDLKRTLLTWLKLEAQVYITSSLQLWSAKMKLPYREVRFRQQKSRWGSCSSQGNLNFNWRLIHFKPEIIDYVIIHELAHLKHHDHSAAFWNLVKQYDPTYKTKVKFLKQQSISIETM